MFFMKHINNLFIWIHSREHITLLYVPPACIQLIKCHTHYYFVTRFISTEEQQFSGFIRALFPVSAVPACQRIVTSSCIIANIQLKSPADDKDTPAHHRRTSTRKNGPAAATESNRPRARMPIIPLEREIRQVFHFYSINIESRQQQGACEVVKGAGPKQARNYAVCRWRRGTNRPYISCIYCFLDHIAGKWELL